MSCRFLFVISIIVAVTNIAYEAYSIGLLILTNRVQSEVLGGVDPGIESPIESGVWHILSYVFLLVVIIVFRRKNRR
jgi:hypothetical protein